MAIGVFGVFLFEFFDEERPFWSRPDEAHVSVEDVEDLRQFVQASGADEFTDFGNAWVVFRRQLGTGRFFCIDAHGTEFVDLVFLAKAADADLAVEDGTAVTEFDSQGNGNSEGQGADGSHTGYDDVDGTLDGPLFHAEAQALRAEDRDIVNFLQHRAVAEDFIRTRDDVRLNFFICTIIDDTRFSRNGDIRADDERIDIADFQFFPPIGFGVHNNMLKLHFELRLSTHTIVDMAAFVFVTYNHDVANGMQALLPMLDRAFPKAKQDELYKCTGNNQDSGISELMDKKAQGHDEDEY